MAKKKEADPIVWVECPEYGTEQADMGRGVQCDECGYGPMPTGDDGRMD